MQCDENQCWWPKPCSELAFNDKVDIHITLSDDSMEQDFSFGRDRLTLDGEKIGQKGKCFLNV